MSDVIQTLQRELAELEAELRDDPRYAKIRGIKELLAVYSAGPSTVRDSETVVRRRANQHVPHENESKKARIRREVAEFLAHGPKHRTEILAHLERQKIVGKERNPMANLAQALSLAKDLFTFDGNGNWSLKK